MNPDYPHSSGQNINIQYNFVGYTFLHTSDNEEEIILTVHFLF